ncbi:MAG: O-antigen ligase family protein, partial [Pseudomonadota bacterium]
LLRLNNSRLSRLSRPDQVYYFAQAEYPNFALLIIAAVCLLLTVSRAGIFIGMASVIGLVIVELIRLSRSSMFRFVRRKRYMIPLGLVFGTVLALALTGEINPYDSEALLQNSSSRLVLYDAYFSIWMERPLFGHGLGSFNALNDSHTTLNNAAHMVTIGAAHSFVLQWLVQQGLVGLLAMAAILGLILRTIVRPFGQTVSTPRIFLRVALAASLLIFTHGLVDYALEIPSVMWTYAYILGLAAGFATNLSVKSTEVADE